jgi:hypothetical protein
MTWRAIWKRHSLSLVATAILIAWVLLYLRSDPRSHAGSFFGNAIADWIGVVVMTKKLLEAGSKQSD